MSSSQGIVLQHTNFQQYLNRKIQNCGFPYPRQNILAHPCFFLSYVLDEFVLYLWGQSFKLFWINIYCFGILKSFLTEIRVQVVKTSVTTTDNSPSQDYTHLDDQTTLLYVTPRFKPFTVRVQMFVCLCDLYSDLHSDLYSDLYSIRCQDMMKTVFKEIQFETMPKYICGLFQMRNTERNLWGLRKLVIPYINTTTYGLHSFRYTSANMWNKLTEDLKSLRSFNESRAKICQTFFKHQYNYYLCR